MTTGPEDTSFGGWRACDMCGEPIAAVEQAALALRASLLEEQRAAAAEAGPDAHPGLVPWDWGHRDCFAGLDVTYVIEGPRIDTLAKLMARTLQLLEEDWFLETAWEDAVRRFYRVPFE